jgi:hypothetical protein
VEVEAENCKNYTLINILQKRWKKKQPTLPPSSLPLMVGSVAEQCEAEEPRRRVETRGRGGGGASGGGVGGDDDAPGEEEGGGAASLEVEKPRE